MSGLLQALRMTVPPEQSDDEIQVAAIALCLECSTIDKAVAGLNVEIRDALVSARGQAPR